jgi:DNA-binding NarL/FixJ family response regulator
MLDSMLIRADIWEIAREPDVLTEKQLRVLECRERHGMSWSQISDSMNLDQATVRGHHRRAQRRLALELERRARRR